MLQKKKLICFHLYNDYSGSPKILKNILQELLNKDYIVYLITSHGGVLDELSHPNLKRKFTYSYHFSHNKIIALLKYIEIQLYTFIITFRFIFDKNSILYINTILPIGPAIAGKIMQKRVIYHYHENAFIKSRFYRTLAWFMQIIADKIICVSNYQASFLHRKTNIVIAPNALSKKFIDHLHPNPTEAIQRQSVLMLSSLKKYKGITEFIQLATALPQYKFTLIINESKKNIERYFNSKPLQQTATNLDILAQQDQITKFYNTTSLVLNLTDKRRCIETFGLTILEAMSNGLPVIVPTVGGIAEMVENDINGYKIDVENLDEIKCKINDILTNKNLYIKLATNALARSQHYTIQTTINAISSCIEKLN